MHPATWYYDQPGRLTNRTYTGTPSTPAVTMTYDDAGRRTSMVDGTGKTCYSYDSLNRLTSYSSRLAANASCANPTGGTTVGYVWDPSSNLVNVAYPGGGCYPTKSGPCATREFDAAGRLAKVTDWLGAGNSTTFDWDANSRLTRQAAPHVEDVFFYNTADQMTGQSHRRDSVENFTLAYGRDPLGQLSSAAQGYGGPTHTYTYNPLSKLAADATTGGGTASYLYDSADNPTTLGASTISGYDAANRPTTRTTGSSTYTYSWDDQGNRTGVSVSGGASWTFGFDAENRQISQSAVSYYGYDGDGLRAWTNVWTAVTYFTYDITAANALALQIGNDNYLYGPGGIPVEKITGTTPTWITHDQLGSTRLLTDSSGATVASYTFDPYGATTSYTGTATSRLQYAAQIKDGDTNNYWMRARIYDPTTGQFLSRDPIAAATRSPYGYVYGNPLNMTDPTGLCGWTDPWDCVVPDDMSGIGEYVRPVINTLNGSNGIGAAIAIVGGGNCYTRGGRIECDNVGMIGGAQTYGDVVLNPGSKRLSDAEFEHESNHSNQWAMFGSAAGFGLAYGGDWLWHGTKRECMWFETAADAGKGNYGSCPGNGTLIDWLLGSSSAAADTLCDDPNRR